MLISRQTHSLLEYLPFSPQGAKQVSRYMTRQFFRLRVKSAFSPFHKEVAEGSESEGQAYFITI